LPNKRTFRLVTLGAAAILLLSACSSSASTPAASAGGGGASMDALIAAAKAEGNLTTIALPHSWCNYGELLTNFASKYGIKINELNPDGSSQQELDAITANKTNKGPAAPDVVDIGLGLVTNAKTQGLITPYKVAAWNDIPASAKDADGYWYGDYYGVLSFEVNTSVVKNEPKDWSDLLKADYKNQVALAGDPTGSNQAISAVWAAALANGGSLDNAQPGLDWFKKLRDTGNLRKGVVLNVASVQKGECPISLVYDFDGFAKRDATGLPLKVIVPQDATVGMLFAQYISAAAPHPNAAKVAIDFFFSDEGQVLLAQGYAHPSRKVALPPEFAANMLPDSAYGKIHFPSGLPAFSAAIKKIADGWNAIVSQ